MLNPAATCSSERRVGVGDAHGERVEPGVVHHVETTGAQPGGGDRGQPLHTLGDAGQAVASVPRGVEPGDVGEQHLRGADVRRRLLAADVLFAGLQCEPKCRTPGGVGADPDDSAGHRPSRRLLRRDERGVRAAEAHRHAEALRRAHGDVGAELARGSGEHAGQQVGHHDRDAARLVDPFDRCGPVGDRAGGGRKAEQRAEEAVSIRVRAARRRRRRVRCRSVRRGSSSR